MHYKPSRGQYDSAQQSYEKLIIKLIKYFPSTTNVYWLAHASYHNTIANANKHNSAKIGFKHRL